MPCSFSPNATVSLLGLILTLYSGVVNTEKLHREEENPEVPNLCSNLETKSNDLPLCVDNHFVFHWYFTCERRVGFSETWAIITCSLLACSCPPITVNFMPGTRNHMKRNQSCSEPAPFLFHFITQYPRKQQLTNPKTIR